MRVEIFKLLLIGIFKITMFCNNSSKEIIHFHGVLLFVLLIINYIR